MKKMKTSRLLSMMLILPMFALQSCDIEILKAFATIIFPDNVTPAPAFLAHGGTDTITFSSTQAWTANVESEKTWCTVSPASGDAGLEITLTITASENEAYDNRTAIVTIASKGEEKAITVTQSQTDSFTFTGVPTEVLPAAENTFAITTAENTGTPEVSELPEWITVAAVPEVKGITTTTLTFTVSENTTYDKREAKITITSGGIAQSFTVQQLNNDSFSFTGVPTEALVAAENSFVITTSQNSSIPTVDILPEWITVAIVPATNGLSNTTLTFTVSENKTYGKREAKITITSDGKPEWFEIEQLYHKSFTFTGVPTAPVPPIKNTFVITTAENTGRPTVGALPEWITVAIAPVTKGLSNTTLTFTVKANSTNAKRSGKITIKSGTETPQSFTITQPSQNLAIDFPDANFKNYLIKYAGINTNSDNEITYHEASLVTALNCQGFKISSLTGIQYFTALTDLTCSDNNLTSLDVSKNLTLTELDCKMNQITALDISKNTALTILNCYDNQITTLDVSKSLKLKTLRCDDNKLTSLDVSKNIALTTLACNINQITALDISENLAMAFLDCNKNKLTALDISKNLALKNLNCNPMNDTAGNNLLVSISKKRGHNVSITKPNATKIIEVTATK